MASLAKSGVTVRDSWYEGGAPTTKKTKVMSVTIVLSSMGGATNTIPASAFGLTTIREVSTLQKSDDTLAVPAAPSYDGTKIFLYNLAQATDANRDDPADFTGTFRCLVKGT